MTVDIAAVSMILDSMNAPKYAAGGEGDAEVEMNVLDRLRSVQFVLTAKDKRLKRMERMEEALVKISKARRLVNGMVIDPCPTVMCYASQTIDVAIEALKEKP